MNQPADEQRELYLEGIARWNRGEFFEAHEAWESAWRAATGEQRRFYHGLIQFAVALLKLQRHCPAGTVKLFERGLAKWTGLPAVCLGLDREAFLRQLRPIVESARGGVTGVEFFTIELIDNYY